MLSGYIQDMTALVMPKSWDSMMLANRNIIFCLYRFSFHKPIKSRLVRGRLYLPLHTLRKHHKICDTTLVKTPVYNSGRSFKNSSVDCDTGKVGFMEATIWRDGSFSLVLTTYRSLDSRLKQ